MPDLKNGDASESKKSISQMLDEYNKMGNDQLAATGFTFRERRSFKDREDAVRSLEKLQSSIRAHKSGLAAAESQKDDPPGVVIERKESEMKKVAKKKKVASATPRGRRAAYAPEQKIVLLQKDNPRREGTAVYKQFEIMKKSPTVGAYLKAGGKLGSLHKSIKRKWARVQ